MPHLALHAVLPDPDPDDARLLDHERGGAGVDDGAYAGLGPALTSASISSLPAKYGAGGRWPRGAGVATVSKGQLFSPSHIRPSVVGGIQVGAS